MIVRLVALKSYLYCFERWSVLQVPTEEKSGIVSFNHFRVFHNTKFITEFYPTYMSAVYGTWHFTGHSIAMKQTFKGKT